MTTKRRLIDANALLPEIVKAQALEPAKAVAKIILLVTEAESVNAVEVVRCKDCESWNACEINGKKILGRCKKNRCVMGRYGFCSYGKRKTTP